MKRSFALMSVVAGLVLAGCASTPEQHWEGGAYEPRISQAVFVAADGQVLDTRQVWLVKTLVPVSHAAVVGLVLGASAGALVGDGSGQVTAVVAGAVAGAIVGSSVQAEGEEIAREEGQEVVVRLWDGRLVRLLTSPAHDFSPGDRVIVDGRDDVVHLRPR